MSFDDAFALPDGVLQRSPHRVCRCLVITTAAAQRSARQARMCESFLSLRRLRERGIRRERVLTNRSIEGRENDR